MKRLVSIAAAAAFSAVAVAGGAHASVMSNSKIDAIRSLQDGRYIVTRIDSLDHSRAATVRADAAVEAASVQQAIRANPALLRDLRAQNVQIGNVVAATEAMDGSMTFYLR